MKIINFLDIYCALLDYQSDSQISYLTKEELIKNSNFPLKEEDDTVKEEIIRDRITKLSDKAICVIVINNNNALTKYKKPIEALANIPGIQAQELKYFNKKFGAVMAGLGQYGKNQLIYNDVFGFDIYISMIMIYNDVINLPVRQPPNYNILSKCENCNLCAINCPAHAIHIEENGPHWLDVNACRNFYMYGNHPTIPSVKHGINCFLNNKYTEEELASVKDYQSFMDLFGFRDKETIVELDGETYSLSIDFCKECMNQNPCRKLQYTYNRDQIQAEKINI